jgi:hypothetical protein
VAPPAGTFLAKVRDGAIQLPPPLKAYCDAEGWDLFRVVRGDHDRLVLEPVLASLSEPVLESLEAEDEFVAASGSADTLSSMSADGRLWIPADVRLSVALLEQNVMMRIENGAIGVYLRKVFDTLGFRP